MFLHFFNVFEAVGLATLMSDTVWIKERENSLNHIYLIFVACKLNVNLMSHKRVIIAYKWVVKNAYVMTEWYWLIIAGCMLCVKVLCMNSMKTCPSVTFYFMKNSFSDISGKWILPNTQCQSQFTPKMKANAISRLLSSLVWIDQYIECSQFPP